MIFRITIGLLCYILSGITGKALAQQSPAVYNSETIFMQGTQRYVKNNVVYAGHKQLLREFSISPGGMDLYIRSRRKRNIAMVFSLVGTASTVYALLNRSHENQRTFFWISLGSAVVSAPLNIAANNQLNQAVWLRNRDALMLLHP